MNASTRTLSVTTDDPGVATDDPGVVRTGGAMLFTPKMGVLTVEEVVDVVHIVDDADAPEGAKASTISKNIQTSYQTCSAEYAINSASVYGRFILTPGQDLDKP
jgi:hypothetical protein